MGAGEHAIEDQADPDQARQQSDRLCDEAFARVRDASRGPEREGDQGDARDQ
jgi:hypothetical protein